MNEEEQSTRRRSSVASITNEDGARNDLSISEETGDDGFISSHRSLPLRAIWLTVGIISLGLGGLGIILPGLPTTPFILLSAFAFLRSSETFYKWLTQSKLFGPILIQWREHRALPSMKVKIVAILFTVSCFIASIIYFAVFTEYWWASLVLGALCMVVCTFLIRLPVVAIHTDQVV